ncbi:MAG: RNA polymerase sigma-70 factor [Fodinibius sp.]|nr:RNA polymerase sigma-70 factor [Fodinibius sp.]
MDNAAPQQIQTWVRKISQSDRQAFDRLFRHFYARLVAFSCKYVKSRASAADIVQESFMKLWQKRRTLDPNRSIKAYLYQMVRNRSLNYIRDHSKETVGLEPLQKSGIRADNNDTDGETSELPDFLRRWIEELPNRQREAFKLSRFEGLDHEEVAEVMGISPNTVNNHIVAALDTLRSRSDEYHNEVSKG